jgi:hypothetical protein
MIDNRDATLMGDAYYQSPCVSTLESLYHSLRQVDFLLLRIPTFLLAASVPLLVS